MESGTFLTTIKTWDGARWRSRRKTTTLSNVLIILTFFSAWHSSWVYGLVLTGVLMGWGLAALIRSAFTQWEMPAAAEDSNAMTTESAPRPETSGIDETKLKQGNASPAPTISPDGRWQWNGSSWIPLLQTPAPKIGSHKLRNGIIAGGVLLLVLIGVGARLDPNYGTNSEHQQATAYLNVNTEPITTTLSQVNTDCNGGVSPVCKSDLETLVSDINDYGYSLDAVGVPACLATGNSDLRAGLDSIKFSAQEVIDAREASQVESGFTSMRQGEGQISQATSELQQEYSNCQ